MRERERNLIRNMNRKTMSDEEYKKEGWKCKCRYCGNVQEYTEKFKCEKCGSNNRSLIRYLKEESK